MMYGRVHRLALLLSQVTRAYLYYNEEKEMDTNVLMNRIIGAFLFRTDVYEDVEKDTSFTPIAWALVAVIGFLNQLGTRGGLVAAIIGVIFVLIGFWLFTWVVAWVGKTVFKATVAQDELIRTLGLAYVWNIFGVLGIFSSGLAVAIGGIAAILGLIASFVAAKAALDLDWVQTIVTVVIGFIVFVAVLFIAGLIMGALGVAAGAVTGA